MNGGQVQRFSHNGLSAEIHHGDALDFLNSLDDESVSLIFSSPPYCIGKPYDRSFEAKDFLIEHERILETLLSKVRPGGSICWQVGVHASQQGLVPLDALVFAAASKFPDLHLRNRIVWTFEHGAHARRRFSGRYETVMWFTKGDDYYFNLDAVRVPQKYPGKRHYKGPLKGQWSGNPLGSGPVKEIPSGSII